MTEHSQNPHPFMRILSRPYTNEEDGEFDSAPYNFKFELDSFQKHAINAIKRGENVLVTAHTGSGKTVPAKFAIADSLAKNKKIIYTSPIKSLSNQKLFELKQNFPDVGILTGDIKFNPDAQCVIMTTEILRNILYQQESQHIDINEIDKVIFDEVHYINDPDRGRVWEECIILMPKRITMIMLSATIDKADEFANWIGTIKQTMTNLIPTQHRVVPLEHYYFLPDVVVENGKYHELIKVVSNTGILENYNEIKRYYKSDKGFKLVNKLVYYLKAHNMTPALFFVFSRKETEKLAKSVQQGLISTEESAEIDNIFNFELRHHKKLYEKSGQYNEIHSLLIKGIAYHHSGLVPILKEVIEILFEKGLIKLLFATETFAVGVNAPTKTVVFPKLTKYSTGGFRHLRTDEYLQMAGRAGRRGLDKYGTVIILPTDDLVEYGILKKLLTGKSPSIQSKFRLNYQFILKIINSDLHNIQEFISQSLLSKDLNVEINQSMYELEQVKEKYKNGLSLNSDEITAIKKYYDKKKMMDTLRGNNWKRESIKLSDMKRDIRGFDRINAIYQKYRELESSIVKLEGQITSAQTVITHDIDRMLNYLYDNHYISLKPPFNALEKEKGNIRLSDMGQLSSDMGQLSSDKIILDLKGIIASQISECNEIMLTEIITNKFFIDLAPEEIIGILAAFIEEKSNDVTNIGSLEVSDRVKEILSSISYIADDFGSYEYNSGIEIQSNWKLYLSFVGPAYEWAKGCSIFEIYNKYPDVYEGTFIRNILRIYNMVENITNIATMCDQPAILKCLECIDKLLIRDQVTTESLYIAK
jgi:superfamily II RNA helicase